MTRCQPVCPRRDGRITRLRCAGVFGVAAWWVMGVGAAQGFDFGLHSVTVNEDGFHREISYFQSGEHSRVNIDLPRIWAKDASSTALTLTNPAAAGMMIRLETSVLAPDVPFTGKTLEIYRLKTLQLLPKGATAVKMIEEHTDPLPIFHWKGYEFVVEYEYFGEAYRRSVLFLDLNAKEQVIVTSLAAKAAYEQVHGICFDLLRSWQVVPVD